MIHFQCDSLILTKCRRLKASTVSFSSKRSPHVFNQFHRRQELDDDDVRRERHRRADVLDRIRSSQEDQIYNLTQRCKFCFSCLGWRIVSMQWFNHPLPNRYTKLPQVVNSLHTLAFLHCSHYIPIKDCQWSTGVRKVSQLCFQQSTV